MVDTPTARFGARKQSLGSNVNTWGDTKLNEVIDLIDRGTKGYQAIAMAGDTTLSWTNYVASNQGQVQTLKLTGSLPEPADLIVPSREWNCTVINAAGNAVTVKTSAGVGVAIPAGAQAHIYCDGADVFNAAPTVFDGPLFAEGGVRANGKLTDISAGTANTDGINKAQLEAAVALASESSSPGTVRVSVLDATPKFLGVAITVSGDLVKSVSNPGGDEKLNIAYTAPAPLPPFLADGGSKTSAFTPDRNTRYNVNCTSAGFTVNLGGVASLQVGDIVFLNKFGPHPMYLAGTVNNSAAGLFVGDTSSYAYTYADPTWGWN